MSKKTRILIHGGIGRMGQSLQRLIPEYPDLELVATPRRSELSSVPEFDVAIDFSLPEGIPGITALCAERNAALVTGTTGVGEDGLSALDALALQVPVLWASNFSLGVAVLDQLVEQAASMLREADWQCDVIEQHHIHKKDAPSGTALTLGDAAARGGATPSYSAIRAGDIVGEHTVQFAGLGERIELIHRATNRDIFARGALRCARMIDGCAPGRYSVKELLFRDAPAGN